MRMKGVGCLNSHLTTVFHWLSRRGRSRWLLIHCTAHPCQHTHCTPCCEVGPLLDKMIRDCRHEEPGDMQAGTAQRTQVLLI